MAEYRIYTPEHWFALVKQHDIGLSVFEPASAFYFSGVRVPGDPVPTGAVIASNEAACIVQF